MSLQTVWHYFLRDSMHAPSLLPEDIVQECLTHMLLKDFLTVGVLTGMLHCLLESLNTPNHSVVVSDLHGTGVLHGPPATSRDIFSVHLDLSRVMRRCHCHYMVTHHLLGPDRFNRWSSPCVLRGVVAPFLCHIQGWNGLYEVEQFRKLFLQEQDIRGRHILEQDIAINLNVGFCYAVGIIFGSCYIKKCYQAFLCIFEHLLNSVLDSCGLRWELLTFFIFGCIGTSQTGEETTIAEDASCLRESL